SFVGHVRYTSGVSRRLGWAPDGFGRREWYATYGKLFCEDLLPLKKLHECGVTEIGLVIFCGANRPLPSGRGSVFRKKDQEQISPVLQPAFHSMWSGLQVWGTCLEAGEGGTTPGLQAKF